MLVEVFGLAVEARLPVSTMMFLESSKTNTSKRSAFPGLVLRNRVPEYLVSRVPRSIARGNDSEDPRSDICALRAG